MQTLEHCLTSSDISLTTVGGGSKSGSGILGRYQGERTPMPSYLKHGMGKYTYDNQFFSFDGIYHYGKKDGRGRLELKDGTTIEGNFTNGEINGHFVKRWLDPGRKQLQYNGQFLKGDQHGKGVLRFRDGSHYKGDFSYNQMHGKGVLTQLDGTYRGSFTHNCKEGRGTFCFTNESWLYHGLWKQDKYHGDGRLIYEGQTVFEGEFLEGSAKFKPSRITLDKNMMKVTRGSPLELRASIDDVRGNPVEGFHFIQLQMTAWFKYHHMPEEEELIKHKDYPKQAKTLEFERSPFYDVTSFPLTSFDTMVQQISNIPEDARAILSEMSDSTVSSTGMTGSGTSAYANMLLLQKEPSELEVHAWPMAPLENLVISTSGFGCFKKFGLPAAQNHGYAPFMVHDFIQARRHSEHLKLVVTHYFGEKSTDPGKHPPIPEDLADINFAKLSPEQVLETILAHHTTRAGEYILKISDVTPQHLIDKLQYERLQPAYCKVKMQEKSVPKKAIIERKKSIIYV
ncbi:uncharacterized protein LOC142338478 [Convolutriloba macropyga]|uniref:uncharacterized protein LOC142338478 n=1 Tax=Convolutriloba macropyga TaxID=536237 RepID=UPI003F51CEFF